MKKKKKPGRKVGRPATGKKTQVMRVSRDTYLRLKEIKGKLTYDELFDEVFEARKLISEAPKVFEVEGKLLRGFDLVQAREVAEKFSENRLKILLELGEDE